MIAYVGLSMPINVKIQNKFIPSVWKIVFGIILFSASVRCCLNFNWFNRLGMLTFISISLDNFYCFDLIAKVFFRLSIPNKWLLHINLYRERKCELIIEVYKNCTIDIIYVHIPELFLWKWKILRIFFQLRSNYT